MIETPMLSSFAGLPEDDDLRFGAVVIGSGFGGAVAAARLASVLGDRVAVFERGLERRPGDFPESIRDAIADIRSAENPHGMFDFRFDRDLDALVGNVLGGGSQLYCGVTLEPLAETFRIRRNDGAPGDRRAWPRSIDDGVLGPYYDMVRHMLEVETWVDRSAAGRPDRIAQDRLRGSWAHQAPSDDAELAPALWRVEAFDLAAERAFGPGSVETVPIAVNITRHHDGQPNRHGVPRKACTACGNCVTGCNEGSKNSLTTNYLPSAVNDGAQIHTGVEVLRIRPSGRPDARWALLCSVSRPGAPPRRRLVYSDTVVFGAGVFGTGAILSASAKAGLDLSPALGTRVSGNGDAIAMAHRPDNEFVAKLPRVADDRPGPTITRMIDLRAVPGRRHLIQDSVHPDSLGPILRDVLALRGGTAGVYTPAASTDLDRSLMMLAMGYDSAGGRLVERRGKMTIEWPDLVDDPVHAASATSMRELAQATGAEFTPNPRVGASGVGTPVTVHALGGAPMGDHPADAVVDDRGRLLDSKGNAHPGLFVTDGSVIPTAAGSNPSLLIAALAERISESIIEHINESAVSGAAL